MDFKQIKTGKGNYTRITDEVIDSIPCIKAFQEDWMNKALHEKHKKLLIYAKNKNYSKEVGLFWNLKDPSGRSLSIKGEIDGFNINTVAEISTLVKNPYNLLSVVVMHNHPRNGLFSSADIRSFIDFDSIVLMTAVCNDGTIYMLRKEGRYFNPLLMEKYYNEGMRLSREAARQEQIKKAKRYNVDINNKEALSKIPTKSYYYGIKNIAKHAKEIGITYRCSVKRK